MSRKQRKITQEQYAKIAYLARRLVPQKIKAKEVLGYSPEAFSRRKKRDAELQKAIQGGYNEAKIALHIAQYRMSIDHYQTICRDCGKISEGEFRESCPYCDRSDPLHEGAHTNVRHKYIAADTTMLIWMGRHHLGQTEKSLLEIKTTTNGDHNRFKDLSEAEIDKKLRSMLPFLATDYGFKLTPIEGQGKLGHDDLLIDIKKCV